jgi:hypothetical protein
LALLPVRDRIAGMKKPLIILASLALALPATAALAAGSAGPVIHGRPDYFAPGRHQFYLWCADGNDRVAYQDGISAEQAQAKLLQADPSAECRPVWQGRITR